MKRRSFLAWLGLAPAAAIAPAPAPAMGATPFGAMLRAPRAVGLAAALQAPLVSETFTFQANGGVIRSIVLDEMRRAGLDIADGEDMQLTEGAGI